jgi:hypothetical protein
MYAPDAFFGAPWPSCGSRGSRGHTAPASTAKTEEYIPEAGLELVKAELVVDELVKLLTARVPG